MISSRLLRSPSLNLIHRVGAAAVQQPTGTVAAVRLLAASSPPQATVTASFSTKASTASNKKATPPPPSPPTSSGGGAAGTTPGQRLAALTQQLPHMDVVRYEHKNRTWTLQHVHYYSEALAIGLMENGFQVGDVVLSYLPSHLQEQMVLQFACSKAGLILYTLDPTLAAKDMSAATQALSAALTLSKANILISQEAANDVSFIALVQGLIPELRIYDCTSGMPFVTPRYPHLRMCIHTGFDQDDKYGWLPLRQMVVPSNNLDTYVASSAITPNTPLAGTFQLDEKGIPTKLGPTLTNAQVLQGSDASWPTVSSILQKKFHTVEGVGVIF